MDTNLILGTILPIVGISVAIAYTIYYVLNRKSPCHDDWKDSSNIQNPTVSMKDNDNDLTVILASKEYPSIGGVNDKKLTRTRSDRAGHFDEELSDSTHTPLMGVDVIEPVKTCSEPSYGSSDSSSSSDSCD